MTWAETEAGTLTNSETILNAPGEIRQVMTERQFLTQVREEKLANLLSSEINETEPLWLDYEYEETQVKLDLADMILQTLCFETIKEVNKIKNPGDPEEELLEKLEENKQDEEPPIIWQIEKSPQNLPIKALAVGIKTNIQSASSPLNRSA